MARGENSGDCPHSSTTRDFEECYSKVLETAEDSLKDFESSIRALMTGPPVRSGTKTICQGLLVRISRPLIDLPNSTRLSVCGTNTRNRLAPPPSTNMTVERVARQVSSHARSDLWQSSPRARPDIRNGSASVGARSRQVRIGGLC